MGVRLHDVEAVVYNQCFFFAGVMQGSRRNNLSIIHSSVYNEHTVQISSLYITPFISLKESKNGNSVTTLWLTCFDDLFHFLGSFSKNLAPKFSAFFATTQQSKPKIMECCIKECTKILFKLMYSNFEISFMLQCLSNPIIIQIKK